MSDQKSRDDKENGDSVVTPLKQDRGELSRKQRCKGGRLNGKKIVAVIKDYQQD